MYHCYLRGKQNELLAIREAIFKIQQAEIVPIIEPVKVRNITPLLNCLKVIQDASAQAIVIINPFVGEWVNDPINSSSNVNRIIRDYPTIQLGIIIDRNQSVINIKNLLETYSTSNFVLIHFGEINDIRGLQQILENNTRINKNIFIDGTVSSHYMESFVNLPRILIKDGFNRLTRNSDYNHNLVEFFSDNHATFQSNDFSGFGDFSAIGSSYNNGQGGPAKTVAVHLTYTLPDDLNSIYIEHFLSEDRTYFESPNLLVEEAFEDVADFLNNLRPDILSWSSACQEILQKFNNMETTNLGYIKKLSIIHHFELMHFLKINNAY